MCSDTECLVLYVQVGVWKDAFNSSGMSNT